MSLNPLIFVIIENPVPLNNPGGFFKKPPDRAV
jgi:hypothetical protein